MMKHEWTPQEKKEFLTDIRVIRRLYAREKTTDEIADMLEKDPEMVELVINLIDDGFYSSDLELLNAAIALL